MHLTDCLSDLLQFSHFSFSDRIGCGLDQLKWDRVSVILEQVFKHSHISITIYSLPERAETTVMK